MREKENQLERLQSEMRIRMQAQKEADRYPAQDEAVCTDVATERHYTVQEIGKLWHLNRSTITRLFAGQPGVLEFGPKEGRFKRPYRSMRIPESVMIRVHRDLLTK